MLEEVVPGVLHWTTRHPRIGVDVSSHFVVASRTLVDPLVPEGGIDLDPARIVLSTRHHLRSSTEFGCPVLCHRSGLHEFEGGPDVQAFEWGDKLAEDVTAVEIDAISPDDTAFLIDAGDGCLLFGDAVMHYEDEIHFVPDRYMVDEGDDPGPVKAAIKDAVRRLLDLPFDTVLFAHGTPLPAGGKDALREFVAA